MRKINSSGIISTFAGTGTSSYNGDGVLATLSNISPVRIAFNHVNELFIVDNLNGRIRKVDVSGVIHTIAGGGLCCSTGNGQLATDTKIGNPGGIAIDSCDNVYISQVDSARIRKVSLNPNCWALQVDNTATKTEITIHPNPAYDNLYIDNVSGMCSYNIIDITGRVVSAGTLQPGSNQVDIGHFMPGLYLLQMQDNTGSRQVTKIVKG